MPSSIGEAELRALDALQRLLLTPPVPHRLDAWRTAVNTRMRALTGADRAVFILPNTTSIVCYADIPYDADVENYPAYVRSHWTQFGMRRRALRLEVFSRAMLYQPYEREVYRSEYYNEAVVPARAYDSLSMTCRTPDDDDLVQLIVHHDRPVGRKFGARELQLMRLLFPAFAAGAAAYRALERRIATLGSMLDRDHDGVALYSTDGTLVHRNPAAAELLDDGAVRSAVRQLVAALAESRGADPRPVVVNAAFGRARVRGCILEENLLAADRLFLVLLERVDAPPVCEEELRRRFRLTRQQARVALLLAERRTNTEIARRLSISIHTAKRHVEQVLARLGVASRHDVERAIPRGDVLRSAIPAD